MTAHVHDSHIHIRFYEPRAFALAKPMFGSPKLIKLPLAPPCALCNSKDIPGELGWVEVFGEMRLFLICGDCADAPKDELEQAVLDKLGLEPAGMPIAAEA
jgi:hypothetical protein